MLLSACIGCPRRQWRCLMHIFVFGTLCHMQNILILSFFMFLLHAFSLSEENGCIISFSKHYMFITEKWVCLLEKPNHIRHKQVWINLIELCCPSTIKLIVCFVRSVVTITNWSVPRAHAKTLLQAKLSLHFCTLLRPSRLAVMPWYLENQLVQLK